MAENYRKLITKTLKKLSTIKLLTDLTTELPKEVDEKVLLANQDILDAIDAAKKVIDKEPDEAFSILCNIPYYLMGPHKGCSKKSQQAKLKREKRPPHPFYVASNAVYSLTDTLRHYIRMLSLEDKKQMGVGKIWNNVMVIGVGHPTEKPTKSPVSHTSTKRRLEL